MIKELLFLTVLSATGLFGSIYSLEYGIVGTSVNYSSSENYQVVSDMSEKNYQSFDQIYEIEEEEFGFLSLYTDMLTGDSAILLTDGVEVVPGWKKTGWFGLFFNETYPWVYHSQLKWIYVQEGSIPGAWFHRENIGWIWTNPEVFPALYSHDYQKWTYLSPVTLNTSLYDYLEGEWFELDKPYAILGGAFNDVGGDIAGLGYYYRWEPVRLEARAANGYEFINWSGGLTGNRSLLEFEATRDLTISANFQNLNNTTPTPAPSPTPSTPIVNDKPKPLTLDDLTPSDREKALAEILIYGESPTFGIKN
jgi:hypothetical protein